MNKHRTFVTGDVLRSAMANLQGEMAKHSCTEKRKTEKIKIFEEYCDLLDEKEGAKRKRRP